MARVLISLLGGRPVPNILAVLHLKPDYLYIIASEDSLLPGGSYEKAISALPDKLKPSQSFSVKPYILQNTIECCQKIASEHLDDEIIINSASEPKTMAFGAYDFAKSLKGSGQNIDICYLSRDGFVWAFRNSDSIESAKITLSEYFTGYGWNVKLKTRVDNDKFSRIVSLLIENIPISHDLLCVIRSSNKGKGKRTIKCHKKLSNDELCLLKEIENLHIFENVKISEGSVSFALNNDEDAQFILTGDWLEYYIFQKAIELFDKGLFDECGWGVEDRTGKGEIDFAGIFGGQIVIASCKTEDSIKRTWFEDLHSKAEQLGKGMCSTLLISSLAKSKRNEKELKDYEKWASERQIVLVMSEDLPYISDILRKIVKSDKQLEPHHIPCYARI